MWWLLAGCISATPGETEGGAFEARASIESLRGTWVFAKDPMGTVPYDGFGEGSTRVFGPDGTIAMTLGKSSFAMEGTVVVRTESPLVLDVNWGQGRTNVYAITFRDADSLILREGDEDGRESFFVRRETP